MSNHLPTFSASAPRADATGPASMTSTPASAPSFPAALPGDAIISPVEGPVFGDPLAGLPSQAREKYLAIQDAAFDAFAMTRPIGEAKDMLRERAQELQRHLQHQEKAPFNLRNDQEIDRLRGELAATKAELDRQERRYGAAGAKAAPLKATAAAIETYVRRFGGYTLAEPVELPTTKGKTPAELLEAQRATIATLKRERKVIEAAPNHSSLARSKAQKFVDDYAELGVPDISILFETNNPMTFAGCYDRLPALPHIISFFMWACRDEIIRKFDRLIDENSEDENALNTFERYDKLREIDSRILEAERAEEAIYEMCIAAGVVAARRTDADPRAVLGINGPKA